MWIEFTTYFKGYLKGVPDNPHVDYEFYHKQFPTLDEFVECYIELSLKEGVVEKVEWRKQEPPDDWIEVEKDILEAEHDLITATLWSLKEIDINRKVSKLLREG